MKKLLRRFVSLVLAVSVLAAAFVYRPPKANAFAVTSAAIVAGVCAIMASIGVTYWAKSTTDAQDYISGKLVEYLQTLTPTPETLQDWLGLVAENTLSIFQILSGNRLRFTADVGNKILDFCRWFVQQTGLVSGGEAVTNAGFVPIKTEVSSSAGEGSTISVVAQSDNVFTVDYYLWRPYSSSEASAGFYVPVDTTANYVTVTCKTSLDSGTWGTGMVESDVNGRVTATHSFVADSVSRVKNPNKYQYLYIRIMFYPSVGNEVGVSGTVSFEITPTEELSVPATAVITPSENVSVPDTIPDDGSIVVVPSATVTESMTVDDAADSILEGVASESGLTATVEGDVVGVPSAWVWLHDLLTGFIDSVLSIPGTIVSGITTALERLFVPTEAFVDSYVATLYGDFDNHFSILSYPFSVLGEFITRLTQSSQQEPIFSWGDVQEPFSGRIIIPAGSYNLNDSLQNSTFAYAHSLYFIVVKGWISFWFLAFLYHWFCDVFKMREADMENPNLDEDFV